MGPLSLFNTAKSTRLKCFSKNLPEMERGSLAQRSEPQAYGQDPRTGGTLTYAQSRLMRICVRLEVRDSLFRLHVLYPENQVKKGPHVESALRLIAYLGQGERLPLSPESNDRNADGLKVICGEGLLYVNFSCIHEMMTLWRVSDVDDHRFEDAPPL